jgi:hypothetical protein
MKKCIIRSEKKFKVIVLDEDDNYPANLVIKPQEYNTGTSSFQLSENDIKMFWTNGTYQGHSVSFFFKDVKIKAIKAPQIQSICDYLNKFSCMEKQELDKLYIEAQKGLKSKLEEEIELLKAERNSLSDEILKLKLIKQKNDELFKLIGELKFL